MPILTIIRNPVQHLSEAIQSARRDLREVFGEDVSRPLQQPVQAPDFFSGSPETHHHILGCYGNDPDCKSDDDDEVGVTHPPGGQQPERQPDREAQQSQLPSHVMACYGNDPDCKSDDDDEVGVGSNPGGQQPERQPDRGAQHNRLPSHVMACYGNDPDCKSDDDDEVGVTRQPGDRRPRREGAEGIADLVQRFASFLETLREPRLALVAIRG